MDQTTFTHLAETYLDMVYRLACHYLRSPQDADDAVQEVFLRLYTAKRPLRARSTCAAGCCG